MLSIVIEVMWGDSAYDSHTTSVCHPSFIRVVDNFLSFSSRINYFCRSLICKVSVVAALAIVLSSRKCKSCGLSAIRSWTLFLMRWCELHTD